MMPRVLRLRFLAALFVSLLLHAAMISGEWLRVPEVTREQQSLEARLASAPAPPPAPPAVKPAPRPRTPARRPAPRHLTMPPVATPAPFALPVDPDLTEAPAETAQAPQPEAAPVPIGQAPAEPPALSQAPELAPLTNLPRKGRIAYTLYYGADAFTVGRTVQTWEVDGDTYKLGSASETSGIVEVFRSQRLVYLSEGKLTERGLKPEKFFMSRTRRGRTEAARARFDWQAGMITLGKVPDQRGVALSAESQDIVSFMYQLALSPPAPGRIRLPITNGSRLETYELEVLDQERIETPLGMLKTLPVKQVRQPGEESIEIWFAVEYRNLPVRIRFFDRGGNPMGEQIVEEIRISDE